MKNLKYNKNNINNNYKLFINLSEYDKNIYHLLEMN